MTVKEILLMNEEEATSKLIEVKSLMRKKAKNFYSKSNRNSKGQPLDEMGYYSLQGLRDWLNMKIDGQTDLLKQIAISRGEV